MSKRPSVLLSIFLYSFKVSVPRDYMALRKIIYKNAFKLPYVLKGHRHALSSLGTAALGTGVRHLPLDQEAARLPS